MRRREFLGILGGAAEVQVRITLLAQTLQELDGRSVVICVACRLRWNHNSRWGSMSLLVTGGRKFHNALFCESAEYKRCASTYWSFLVLRCASLAAMNARMSSAMSSSLSHCSLYKVTGNRPIP